VGAGHGVSSFVVQPGGGRKFDWWQMAMFGNRADAIELQIRHCTWPIPDAEKSSLTKAILVSSLDFEIENDVFTKHVSEAAYGDIIGDEELRDLISRYCGGNHVDLLRLPGIRDDQVRISAEDGPSDAAGLVLAVAELNLEIAMSIRLNGCDISTFNQAGRLLRHKLARSRFPEVAIDGFSRMLELHRLPDIPAAVAAGRVAVSDIWTARNTPAARKFRKWLAAAELFDSKDLAALYVDAIGREPLISRLPVKTVRWLLTLGAEYVATSYLDASIGGVAGMALSATDGLFVDAWLRGYSPRLFIDELKQLRFEPRLVK